MSLMQEWKCTLGIRPAQPATLSFFQSILYKEVYNILIIAVKSIVLGIRADSLKDSKH